MEKWKLKRIIKILSILILCPIPGFIISNLMFDDITFIYLYFVNAYIVCIIGVIIAYIITNMIKKKNQDNTQDYYIEIDKEYTPAMASYILDGVLEINEALLATILDLNLKEYLKFEEKYDELKIEVRNKLIEDLYEHEKYIIRNIRNNVEIEPKEFERKLILDCKLKKLIIEEKSFVSDLLTRILKMLKVIAIIIGIICFLVVIDKLPFIEFFQRGIVLILGICFIRYIIKFMIKETEKTREGKKLAKKVKGLKNYIKHYTLLKERDYNYTIVVERYLPYALALGEASKIEKTHVEYNKLIKRYVSKDF